MWGFMPVDKSGLLLSFIESILVLRLYASPGQCTIYLFREFFFCSLVYYSFDFSPSRPLQTYTELVA
jgi:hypothetical protein